MKLVLLSLLACLLGAASLPIDLKDEALVVGGAPCTGVRSGNGCPASEIWGGPPTAVFCNAIDVQGLGTGSPGALLDVSAFQGYNCNEISLPQDITTCGTMTISISGCDPHYAWIPIF